MLIDLEVQNRIGYLALNRPDALNALNQQMIDDMEAALHAVSTDERIAVLIVTGRGGAFCSGSDLKALYDTPAAEAERLARRTAWVCRLFEELPQPTIAAIEGYALGGGVALTLYQNIRVASENAVFGFPTVKLGWNPAFGMARLTRLVGRGWASDLMLTGRTIDAHEALRIRLIDRVVPPSELMPAAEALARQIADNPSAGVHAVKSVMREEENLILEEADDFELRAFGRCVETEEAQARIRAFVEKKARKDAEEPPAGNESE